METVFQKKGYKKTIGVVGCEAGCGCTHICVCLAGYVKGAAGMRSAVAEIHQHSAFGKLEQCYNGSSFIDSKTKCFSIMGVEYHKQVGLEGVIELFQSDADYLIFDFGHEYEKIRREFIRCQKCVVAASLREWKIQSFLEFLEKTRDEPGRREWSYLVKEGYIEDIKEIEREYRIKLYRLPDEEDPFHIKRENLSFYARLF